MPLHNPENAGLLRQLAAGFYDWLLAIAVMMVLSLPFVIPTDNAVEPGNSWYQIFLLGIVWIFFVGFWVGRGQTPGMRAWKLELVNRQGGRISMLQGTTRLLIAALGLALAGAGYWWQLFDKDQLSWHDRAAGTRLIRAPKQQD